ncbi:alpha-crystallin B chain-like isoform X2 [Lycorma delicatula]
MLVDVRGYQPSELKVSVSSCGIELTANHEQTVKIATGSGYANRVITRVYELPLSVYSEQVVCNLSPDGVLFLSAPWSKRQ